MLSLSLSHLDVLIIQLKRQKAVVSDSDADGRESSGSGMEKIEQQAQTDQGRGQKISDPVTG